MLVVFIDKNQLVEAVFESKNELVCTGQSTLKTLNQLSATLVLMLLLEGQQLDKCK